MKIIGLTGSIGTGKSTVSAILRRKGIEIVDADEVSRTVAKVGGDGYSRTVEVFGNKILNDDKSIDRKKLGEIVFSNPNERKKLNEAMHPAIMKEIDNRIRLIEKKGCEIVVLDAPLLIETRLDRVVDIVVLVVCDEQTQVERIQKRDGISREQALMRIASQMSQDEKKKHADYIIDNSYDMESLKEQVEKFISSVEVAAS